MAFIQIFIVMEFEFGLFFLFSCFKSVCRLQSRSVNYHKINYLALFSFVRQCWLSVRTFHNSSNPSNTMAVRRIILSSMWFSSILWAGESCNNDNSVNGFALVDHVYKSFFADRLVSCYMSCSTQPTCQSLNYNLADKTCEFNNDTKYYRPKYFVEKPPFVYAENPDSGKWR